MSIRTAAIKKNEGRKYKIQLLIVLCRNMTRTRLFRLDMKMKILKISQNFVLNLKIIFSSRALLKNVGKGYAINISCYWESNAPLLRFGWLETAPPPPSSSLSDTFLVRKFSVGAFQLKNVRLLRMIKLCLKYMVSPPLVALPTCRSKVNENRGR